MSFIKKLFGFGNKETVEEIEVNEHSENVVIENQNNDEEMEVHDTDEYDVVELLDDEDEVKEVLLEKSIEEIVGDVTEAVGKHEKEALTETYEKIDSQQEQLKDDIGIFEEVVDIEIEVTEDSDETTELIVDQPAPKVVGVLEGDLEPKNTDVDAQLDVKIEVTIESQTEDTLETVEVEVEELETQETETQETEVDSTESIEEVVEFLEEKQNKKSFFAKLKDGVKKTRDSIFSNINSVFNMFTSIDEDLFEELEEALILADMGVDTSLHIITELRKTVKKKGITEVHEVKSALIEIISEILNKDEEEFKIKPQTVILIIGVNGAGKTTTIGKLSNNFIKDGYTVTVAAADTFRAAAIEQLQVWAERSGAHLIRKEEGSDPASVVFDACKSAKAKNTDILIVDTAGRLQNKKNLMEELKKINRIIEREFPEAQREVLLVLDSTTGQNAMQQAKLFNETADITGLVLTKLDGTAKGGVIVSIKNELKVPVRFVGLGEKIDDLEPFDSKQFAKALFEN